MHGATIKIHTKVRKCNFTLTVTLIRLTCSKFMFDVKGSLLEIDA
jgi:hypothetical protein